MSSLKQSLGCLWDVVAYVGNTVRMVPVVLKLVKVYKVLGGKAKLTFITTPLMLISVVLQCSLSFESFPTIFTSNLGAGGRTTGST